MLVFCMAHDIEPTDDLPLPRTRWSDDVRVILHPGIAYSELAQYNRAMTPPFDVRGGRFYVSDRPGLGHDLADDYLKEAVPY